MDVQNALAWFAGAILLSVLFSGCESEEDEKSNNGIVYQEFKVVDHWSDPVESGDSYSFYTTDGWTVRCGDYTWIRKQRESCSGFSNEGRPSRGDTVEIGYKPSEMHATAKRIKAYEITTWRAECMSTETNVHEVKTFEKDN